MARTRKRHTMIVEVSAPTKARAAQIRTLVAHMIRDLQEDWALETGPYEIGQMKLISVKPAPKA